MYQRINTGLGYVCSICNLVSVKKYICVCFLVSYVCPIVAMFAQEWFANAIDDVGILVECVDNRYLSMQIATEKHAFIMIASVSCSAMVPRSFHRGTVSKEEPIERGLDSHFLFIGP